MELSDLKHGRPNSFLWAEFHEFSDTSSVNTHVLSNVSSENSLYEPVALDHFSSDHLLVLSDVYSV
jgi:hypothetical protein